MKMLSEFIGQNIEIVTPSCFKSEFNLEAGGSTICTLKSINFWNTRQEISGFGKSWEIYSESVWKGRTEIKEKNKELPLAHYEGGGLKHSGTFFLPQGERVNLVFNLWKSFYELQNERGEVLAHLANKSFFSSTIVITINRKSEVLDKYPFLLLFAFNIAQQRKHAAAA